MVENDSTKTKSEIMEEKIVKIVDRHHVISESLWNKTIGCYETIHRTPDWMNLLNEEELKRLKNHKIKITIEPIE